MLKLLIPIQEKKRFQDIFRFLVENHCEISLFAEGLRWRNEKAQGLIYRNAFHEYQIKKTKPLGKININRKVLKEFFNHWKEAGNLVEIPLA